MNNSNAINSRKYESPKLESVTLLVERGYQLSSTLENMYGTEDDWD